MLLQTSKHWLRNRQWTLWKHQKNLAFIIVYFCQSPHFSETNHAYLREISLYFLQGLGHTLKSKVQGQLQIEKLKNLADDPYTLEKISAAVIVILSWNYGEEPRIEELGPSIKKEHHDLSKIDQSFLNGNLNISMLVSEIIKQLNIQPAAPLVFGSLVTRLEKDHDQTGPRLKKTGNY